jgi:hypothetical protein
METKKQKLAMLSDLKTKRPQIIRELRESHNRLKKGENVQHNAIAILNGLICLFEMDDLIASWDRTQK